MKIYKSIVGIFSCLLLVACAAKNINSTKSVMGVKAVLSNGYSVVLPQNIQIMTISSGEMDFDLYALKERDGRVLAKLYIGNAPDSKLVNRNLLIFANFKVGSFNGIEKTRPCGGEKCGEILVRLDVKGCPQYVHVLFNDLTTDELHTVENTFHSLTHE